MTRLTALNRDQASSRSKELFDGIQAKLGTVPNMMRTMGNSSAVLEGYLNLSESLSKGGLGSKMGELIAMTVAEANACDYCLSAHAYIGTKLAGIEAEELNASRDAQHNDPKVEAGLYFAKTLVEKQGKPSFEEVMAVLGAGYTEGEVGEIIAHVALNILTNYFNNTANTEIDFPKVRANGNAVL
ncbi:carboxymuconolactone decarboxylase family protein [Fulvivirga lutimaris]|uniref:carboxymuconolactone decarboxylase family protein n=1 Tax=Fulvivirga lutimaris TaxID=1819566 RepID=UPI0012BBA2A6|nr:carboxymuconolactone decarboxylase family protein [Fulvivirga lutimaris]MTI40999.1 carboxymuconolactone decarboxylase family protein [Fulvivirga lutimaris]